MAYRADNSQTSLQVVVDNVASPAGDVQVFKLWDGTAGSTTPIPGDAHGLYHQTGVAQTTAVTSVGASTSTTTLLAAAGSPQVRRGVTIYNNSSSAMYVKLGAGASTASFTVKLGGTTGAFAVGTYFEVPYNYVGIITAVWDTATGAALVTEVTW